MRTVTGITLTTVIGTGGMVMSAAGITIGWRVTIQPPTDTEKFATRTVYV